MKLNITIYRALELGTKNNYVIGFLGQDFKLRYTIDFYNNQMVFETYIIDPTTLEISFDNGKNWDKTEWCKNMLNIARNAMETFREVQK